MIVILKTGYIDIKFIGINNKIGGGGVMVWRGVRYNVSCRLLIKIKCIYFLDGKDYYLWVKKYELYEVKIEFLVKF